MGKKRDPYAIKVGVLVALCIVVVVAAEEVAPAVFVFGDSLADVGNNNNLPLSLAKADFMHNGIDFPTHKPTGRFSNGKNAADFLAEKVGGSSPPPYLYMLRHQMTNFEAGVNFASGGAGIFNATDQLFGQSVPLSRQIDYYSTVGAKMGLQHGQSSFQSLQSKAIHAIIIGSNDILGYHSPSSNFSNQFNPQQFVALMVTTIKTQIQLIYEIGGRKFMVLGIPAIGCCPQQRIKSATGECNAAANAMASSYNQGLRSVLITLTTNLEGFHYTYFDTYNMLLSFTDNPPLYGFKEVKAACCGLGKLNADVPCLPISTYCSNRTDHLFWDLYHPTEAADRFVIDTAYDDVMRFTYPINLSQLVSI